MSQITEDFVPYHPIVSAQEILTPKDWTTEQDGYELISVQKKTSPESIRKAYLRSNIEPLEKAMEKGSEGVRTFFNAAAMRKRRLLK